MNKIFLTGATCLLLLGTACKTKGRDNAAGTTSTPTTTVTEETPNVPVVVAQDEMLRKGLTDATKDIKGLTARVDSGVVYLSGTISREDNMRITPTINSLRPKKINRDQLTVQ